MCVHECPSESGQDICLYEPDGFTMADDYCYTTYASYAYNQFCLPLTGDDGNTTYYDMVLGYIMSDLKLMERAASDFILTRELTAQGLGAAMLAGLLWICVISFCANQTCVKVMIWFSVAFTIGLLSLLGWTYWTNYQDYMSEACPSQLVFNSTCGGGRAMFLEIMTFLCPVSSLIYLTVMVRQRNKIHFAIHCYEECLKPLKDMPGLISWSVFVFFLSCASLYGFIYVYIVNLASGSIKTLQGPVAFPSANHLYRAWAEPSNLFGINIFYLFMCYWTICSLNSLHRTVVSMSTSVWYFTREKMVVQDNSPIWRSIKMALKYHLGTIVGGPIIMTFGWPLREFLSWVKGRLLKADKRTKSFKFWMAFWSCWLKFYEEYLKYITSTAYDNTGVYGDNYFNSAQNAFYLKVRNESRLKEFRENIQFWVPLIGKLFMGLTGTVYLYQWILTEQDIFDLGKIEFPFLPPTLVFMGCMLISEPFANLGMIITETMIYSFICDEEMYLGRQRLAQTEMKLFMDGHGKEAPKHLADYKIKAFGKKGQADDEEGEEDKGVIGSGQAVLAFMDTGGGQFKVEREAAHDFTPQILVDEYVEEEPSYQVRRVPKQEEPQTDDRLVEPEPEEEEEVEEPHEDLYNYEDQAPVDDGLRDRKGVDLGDGDGDDNQGNMKGGHTDLLGDEDDDQDGKNEDDLVLDDSVNKEKHDSENSEDEEDLDKNKKNDLFGMKRQTIDF
jgi:hypothetical protein